MIEQKKIDVMGELKTISNNLRALHDAATGQGFKDLTIAVNKLCGLVRLMFQYQAEQANTSKSVVDSNESTEDLENVLQGIADRAADKAAEKAAKAVAEQFFRHNPNGV